jgi:hypothetical protein
MWVSELVPSQQSYDKMSDNIELTCSENINLKQYVSHELSLFKFQENSL